MKQFADVSGPRMPQESLLRLAGEAGAPAAGRREPPSSGTPRERQDVLRALDQLRQADRDHVDAVEEIRAKESLLDESGEVPPRGDEQPGAEGMRGGAAQAPERLLLEDSQELGLRRRRERRGVVEVGGPVRRDLEEPSPADTAPVNAPRSCPNISLSKSSSERLAASMRTNGSPAREEASCSARARWSLPVPLSPAIRIVLGSSSARSSAAISRASARFLVRKRSDNDRLFAMGC